MTPKQPSNQPDHKESRLVEDGSGITVSAGSSSPMYSAGMRAGLLGERADSEDGKYIEGHELGSKIRAAQDSALKDKKAPR